MEFLSKKSQLHVFQKWDEPIYALIQGLWADLVIWVDSVIWADSVRWAGSEIWVHSVIWVGHTCGSTLRWSIEMEHVVCYENNFRGTDDARPKFSVEILNVRRLRLNHI